MLVEKRVMLYILFFIVIVAAFGITCTLITFIVMKTREIGLMKALGASNRQVMWVFIGQSIVVSVLGILVGLTLGLLAVHYRNEFLEVMRRFTGMELFPASIYNFSQLPAKIVVGRHCDYLRGFAVDLPGGGGLSGALRQPAQSGGGTALRMKTARQA